jgi:hypothetical protein
MHPIVILKRINVLYLFVVMFQHGRRRSREVGAGRQSQLRSPAVTRPPTARVTLQGWLHKQGSEGLMLWKRRWFVLSEYCLFYYKGICKQII